MSKKYQVFISSTYQDLKEERDQVIKAVLEMGHIPVGMEMFSAADEEQWKIIARQIDDADYYAVLIAHRYGSLAKDGVSYTEKEFDYAVSKGVPILGFVIDDSAAWPNDRRDDAKVVKKLNNFKSKVRARLIHFWSSKEELHGKFSISLMKAITANPRSGWVKASDSPGLEATKELVRLSSENATLRSALEAFKRKEASRDDEITHVIKVLHNNKRRIKVREKTSASWDDAKVFSCTLADVFIYGATNLISESSTLGFSQNLALELVGTKYFENYPVGRNVASELLADFIALELVETSRKKHPVSDKTSYWSLTKLGKQVHKEFRRVELEAGLSSEEQRVGDD